MQFIQDLREAGIIDLECTCGAKFGSSDQALEIALRHVAMWHCSDAERKDRRLLLYRIAKLLSPNPVLNYEIEEDTDGTQKL